MAQVKAHILRDIHNQINEYVKAADDLVCDYRDSGKALPNDIKQRHATIGSIVQGLQEAIVIIMKCECDRHARY